MPVQVPLKVVAMAFGLYAPPTIPVYIDAPATSQLPNGEAAKTTVGEIMEEFQASPTQVECCIRAERIAAVRRAIAALPETLRFVVEQRLDGLTLEEIGAKLGRSRERARQIERDALRALRVALADHGAQGDLSIAQRDTQGI